MALPNAPVLFTSIQNQQAPLNYCFYGFAFASGGLAHIVATNGVGLVTNGFIWQGPEIWFDRDLALSLATTWNASAGYSGCVAASLVTTAWTAAAGYSGAASASLVSTTWAQSSAFGMSEYEIGF